MSKTTERRGISRINTVIVAVFALAALVVLVAGHPDSAVLLGVIAVVWLLSSLTSARPEVSDASRIEGLEYRDERDRQLALKGFAAVGVAALVLSFGAFLVSLLVDGIDRWLAVQMIVLFVVWGVANRIAVRRG
ncbi:MULTISPECIES: hypothetical protein [Clavibacter]|uniref:Uncharacterized protein n=2 Tax=Clavibacter TaxID=1573 RepID=A0A399NUH2_9MICO|nr:MULTISPECIES: hypothetical protein [Clavibacter]KDP92207.1 hypothetical protein W824_03580 [Clavibacter cf. michiganensis LMG 26808]RII96276.1 hypothetical protein DZF96_12050 [Clavibacter michiganensis]UKF24951.1 hypothetical protein KYT88_14755 [Clavibacter sp. A6099]